MELKLPEELEQQARAQQHGMAKIGMRILRWRIEQQLELINEVVALADLGKFEECNTPMVIIAKLARQNQPAFDNVLPPLSASTKIDPFPPSEFTDLLSKLRTYR